MSDFDELHVVPSARKVRRFVAIRLLSFALVAGGLIVRDWQVFLVMAGLTLIMFPIAVTITRSMFSFTLSKDGVLTSFLMMKWGDIVKVKKDMFSSMYQIQTKGTLTGRSSVLPGEELFEDDFCLKSTLAKYAPSGHVILQVVKGK